MTFEEWQRKIRGAIPHGVMDLLRAAYTVGQQSKDKEREDCEQCRGMGVVFRSAGGPFVGGGFFLCEFCGGTTKENA